MSGPGWQTSSDPTVTAASVGVASAQCIGANVARSAIFFHNPNTVASAIQISICPASFGAAVLNGAGTLTLGPGGSALFDITKTGGAYNAIASGAASALTIWEF